MVLLHFRSLSLVVITLSVLSVTSLVQSLASAHDELTNRSTIGEITFSLADGLVIEKVADEPLVKWPIVVDFDRQGRLVVAESAGVAAPIQENNSLARHKIIRLVDDNGDGVFDRRIVAADKMAFPEGVLCIGDSILVSAPPLIWKLDDNDGDGVCEQREVWFDGTTVTYCANDLHGPYLGLDGWIYWCKGGFGDQTHVWSDGRTIQSAASHVYRRKFDGGPIEMVVAGGMDNPVEVAFVPEGEKFFTSTFLHHPGGGLRDGIAHGVYGGLFGKDHDVIRGQTRTGNLMPVMTELGPAAPSGLTCLHHNRIMPFVNTDDVVSDRTLVSAQFNLQRVAAHHLILQGATYRTVDHDLVVSDRVDFHPTDVIEDADGSLLIVDTGGWYDLCCPTSRVNQKTASGGIYRIKQSSRASPGPANLETTASVSDLYDPRPWVRREAGFALQKSPSDAITPLAKLLRDEGKSTDQRLTALWMLCRIGTDEALSIVSEMITQSDPAITRAAIHAIAIHRDATRLSQLHLALQDLDAAISRAAAEAIGRIGDESSAEHLLKAIDRKLDDRFLEHSILYALTELQRTKSRLNLIELATTDLQRRAAFMVTDQTEASDTIKPSDLLSALRSESEPLRSTAADILSKHSEWAESSMEKLNELFANGEVSEPIARVIEGWRYEAAMQKLVQQWVERAAQSDASAQSFLASHLGDFSPAHVPNAWMEPITRWLETAPPSIQRSLIASLSEVRWEKGKSETFGDSIVRLAKSADSPLRQLEFLAALPDGHSLSDATLERLMIDGLISDDAAMATKSLRRVKLSVEGATYLVRQLASVSPAYFATAVEAIRRAGDEQVDHEMLDQLHSIPTTKTLPQDLLSSIYHNSSESLRRKAADVTEQWTKPPTDIREAVDAKLEMLTEGDPIRGLQVFHGKKAACGACHQMGYVGGRVGPELTRIGGSRTPEAILEAILFPSVRLEQSYRSTSVLTVDGQVFNGLIQQQTDRVIQLQVAADRVITIEKDDIEQTQPSEVSVMPTGLAEQLTGAELSDLMALLRLAK